MYTLLMHQCKTGSARAQMSPWCQALVCGLFRNEVPCCGATRLSYASLGFFSSSYPKRFSHKHAHTHTHSLTHTHTHTNTHTHTHTHTHTLIHKHTHTHTH